MLTRSTQFALRPVAHRSRFGALAWLALVGLSAARSASAHELWLQQRHGEARAHFGEFSLNLREASPGYLDKLTRPEAWLRSASGRRALMVVRETDGLKLPVRASGGQSLVIVDDAYPLIEGRGSGSTCWTPAARLVPDLLHQTPPELMLDLLPTGKLGVLQVVFDGAPLAGVEVKLTAHSGWSLTDRTDESGHVQFGLPWRGRYVALVRHRVKEPGRRTVAGKVERFDQQSYATTLAFETSSGLPSPPPPPRAAPNQPPAAN